METAVAARAPEPASDAVKPEEWDLPAVDTLGEVGAGTANVMEGLDNASPAAGFEANSEDSTCEPFGKSSGNKEAGADDNPAKAPAPGKQPGNSSSDDVANREGGGSDTGAQGAAPEEAPAANGSAKCRVGRRRTSKYCGVCSANRRNQWQARILMHGKVTHLGYFDTEEEAARVYDIVSLSLHREKANTNFPMSDYTSGTHAQRASKLCGLSREELQRSLGVKPIHKTSRYNGVSKKRGKWVAKVMIDKKLVYHASFEDEKEAALAYDAAVRRLKPNKAHAYVNFVEPASVDAANVSNVKAFGKREGLPPAGVVSQGRPAQPMHMLSSGDIHMNPAPVNVWSHGLMPRMPFHHMRGPSPDSMMMASRQNMVPPPKALNPMYDGGQEFDTTLATGMTSQQQFMPQAQNPRIPGPGQMMPPDLTESWGAEGVMDPNQWLAMRAQHPAMNPGFASSGMPHIQRKDDVRPPHVPQMGHLAAPRPPMMWDPSMSLLKMPMSHPGPMDNMVREPLRSHVQGLIQPPGMGGPERQQSNASAWTSQQISGPPGGMEMDQASGPMMGRGFLMSSPHMWGAGAS